MKAAIRIGWFTERW